MFRGQGILFFLLFFFRVTRYIIIGINKSRSQHVPMIYTASINCSPLCCSASLQLPRTGDPSLFYSTRAKPQQDLSHVVQARYDLFPYIYGNFKLSIPISSWIWQYHRSDQKTTNVMIHNLFFLFGELIVFYAVLGGKAKPLKQPKADKKEYDEVYLIYYLMDLCRSRRSTFYWILLILNTTFGIEDEIGLFSFFCLFVLGLKSGYWIVCS